MSEQCQSVRKQVHEYLDGEIGEAASAELDEHFSRCDECRSILVEVRSVSRAVRQKAARHDAPAHLAVRIRERIGGGETGRSRFRLWEFISPRPVAAVIILALAATFYFTLKTPKSLAVAREVTEDCFDDHEVCDDLSAVPHHIYTSDHEELGRSLTEELGFFVEIPDLTREGYRLVEGHSCEVIGRLSAHAYYKGDDVEDRLSFFCVPRAVEEGALGERLDIGRDVYVPPTDCWREELEKGMNIAMWRSEGGRLCVLLGHMSRAELENALENCVFSPSGD